MKRTNKQRTPRKKTRYCLVQALYEWFVANNEAVAIEARYRIEAHQSMDLPYFAEIFQAITSNISHFQSLFSPYLSRDIARLGYIEHAILCVATYELENSLELPYKVVLNEAVELAKVFGATESHRFVNAVLDKVALALRQAERNTKQIDKPKPSLLETTSGELISSMAQ